MPIERRTLRSQVRDELLARMRSGLIEPGESINEVALANDLGVSRTPLREALIALESEGQVGSEGGKGFRFMPMSAREFTELAPILATLEALAIELTPVETLEQIGNRLADMSAAFDAEVAAHSLIMTNDDEWHEYLISGCDNQRLLDLISTTRQAFHRYESLLVGGEERLDRVAAEHAEIARRLVARDVPGAIDALRVNWDNGVSRILDAARRTNLIA